MFYVIWNNYTLIFLYATPLYKLSGVQFLVKEIRDNYIIFMSKRSAFEKLWKFKSDYIDFFNRFYLYYHS